VGVGGDREFDTALFRQSAVTPDESRDDIAYGFHQSAPVVAVIAVTFHLQGFYAQIIVSLVLTHPRQMIPDQEIGQVLIVEIHNRLALLLGQAGYFHQSVKGGETVDQMFLIGPAAAPYQFRPGLPVDRETGTGQRGQQRIADQGAFLQPRLNLPGIVIQLFQQHGGKIDHRPGIRVAFQVDQHIQVVLGAVKIDPG